MSRDSSGNYTLPSGNPVVGGNPILADGWANPTLNDLAVEMTNSLDRNGRGGMLVPFKFVDGTEAAPGISWTSEPGSGFYKAASGDMRATVLSQDVARFSSVTGLGDRREVTPAVFDFFRVASSKHFSVDSDLRGGIVSGDATETKVSIDGTQALSLTAGLLTSAAQIADLLDAATPAAMGWRLQNNANDATRAELSITAAGAMLLKNYGPNQPLTLAGRNAADDADRALASWVPEGAMTAHHSGLPFMISQADGVQFRDTSGDDVRIELADDAGVLNGDLRATAANFYIRAQPNSAHAVIQARNAGGVLQEQANFDPDAGFTFYHSGVIRLESQTAQITRLRGDGSGMVLRFTSATASEYGRISTTPSNTILMAAAGGEVSLQRNGGTNVLSTNSSGDVILYAAGNARLRANASAASNSFAKVDDGGGTERPVGFNILPHSSPSGSFSLTESQVGTRLDISGTVTNMNVPTGLAAGSTIIITNRSGATIPLNAGGGMTISWFTGGGVTTGNRTLAIGSSVTVCYRTTSAVDIWGSGIS